MPNYYHPGEIAVQQRDGEFDPADLAGNGLGTEFKETAQTFLGAQPWALISAQDAEGHVWVSVLEGPPGFLRIENAGKLLVRAALPKTDPLTNVFQQESEIGMLAIELGTRRRMRVNGRAQQNEGGLRVVAREVYGNCPKYIQRREVAERAMSQ